MAERPTSKWTNPTIALIILIGLGVLVGMREAPSVPSEDETTAVEELQQTTVVRTVSYQGQDGKTAFDLLKESNEVATLESDTGVFVTKIDEVGGDPDTYWLYYVDGEPATMAADAYETQNGQTIEWRYEKF